MFSKASYGIAQSASARILVVDDEPHVCNLLGRFLEAEGYDCVTAYSVEEALVTAVDDRETGVLAVESGAFGYII